MCAQRVLVEGHVGRVDRQGAALCHRVAGVHGEVHHDLFDLRAIGLDRPGAVREVGVHRDVLAECPREHLLQLADNRGDVEHLHGPGFLACEQQELAYECRGALGGAARLVDLAACGVVFGEVLQREVAVVEDDREQIVHVVRDPTGELPDALQPLGLGEDALRALLLGDVAGDRGDACDLAVAVLGRGDAQRDLDTGAALAYARRFVVLDGLPAQHARRDVHLVAVLRGHDELRGFGPRPADHLGRGVPVELLGARVPTRHHTVLVGRDDRVGGGAHDRRERGAIEKANSREIVFKCALSIAPRTENQCKFTADFSVFPL